jgi:DNA-binding IclR family transcriptional regulator
MSEKEGLVASVDRALSILGAYRPGDVALSLHELAERTGFYKSTILRLISTLERHHCIQRLDDGRYQLGSMLLHWGGMYQSSLRLEDHVMPVLRALVAKTGEGASFFTREGDVRVCLFRVDSTHTLRDHIRAGDLLPLDRGAAGRVFLMFDPLLPSSSRTPKSVPVMTVGERETGIAAVAVPVFGAGGLLRGALAVSGPDNRFGAKVVPAIDRALLSHAIDLTRRLGGDPAPLQGPSASAPKASRRPSSAARTVASRS